ncbi:hypothetical protein HRG_005111 [Hirsutella rhossiliensis]|uniref:Uncharacterized protein n=1 Tax=Hirsutella rhossiliensis TaxID=111463 RepID=A0A9P8SIX6_9HYPO|nr:uncharacterized protein HRG_05111 [Hirsutella rhossiliensis]KAH0964683.1 hypothetical protein HRG_05111 [Hirsutella rhossiliensis]
MVKPTNPLALAAFGVSMAVAGVAATSCIVTVTVTATVATVAAARPSSCFPTELDCAVLVSYCGVPPFTATSSASASSSVRGPPGSRPPPPIETLPYGRKSSEHGATTTTTVLGEVTRLVPVPESTPRASLSASSALGAPVDDQLSGTSRGPLWGHNTYERANCSTSICTGTHTRPAPRYGSSSTHGEAILTAVSSAGATGSISASSSVAGSPASSQASEGTTAWPGHHAPSSSGAGSTPSMSKPRTDTPGGYEFSIPVPSPMPSDVRGSSTATSFSESVDAATGSGSTSSDAGVSPGTTLLTTRKPPAQSPMSSTGPPAGPATAPYEPSSSEASSAEAPSYTEPPSYRTRVRPSKR